jgi:uncharacterized membrane protein YjdF
MVPNILLAALVAFALAALVAGEWLGAYDKFWWWDDMLHAVSGVIIGFIGFLVVYFLNARYRMTISPLLVAVFAFTFAVTIGVLWEIIEFMSDALLHTDMQRWNLPADAQLIGRSYQGVGLRDTMSDLIVSTIGALLTSTLGYFAYKYEKPTVLWVMRHTVRRLNLLRRKNVKK